MKKFTIQAVFLVIIIFLGLAVATSKISAPFSILQTKQEDVTRVLKIGNTEIQVEISDTRDKRAKGLGGREKIASNSGMLFVFSKSDKYSFWMKGLKFPLDMIWIKDNMVVDIIKNAKQPEPNQRDETLPIYLPKETVDTVLEVNSGFVDSHNIQIGDKIDIR